MEKICEFFYKPFALHYDKTKFYVGIWNRGRHLDVYTLDETWNW